MHEVMVKMMIQMQLTEGLEFGDLKGLVNSTVMIDLHRPKIGDDEDTVVVAFDVTYEQPAKALSQFIETGALDHLDVEVSGSPDQDGTWKVFVEFMRDQDLFDKIKGMLQGIDQITSRAKGSVWTYRAFNVKKAVKFNADNFKRDIIDSRYEYRKQYLSNKKQNAESTPGTLEEKWINTIRENQQRNV